MLNFENIELPFSPCNFKQRFLFITPNIVSYCGVISALIAARLVSCDSRALHKLSFVFFQIRTWMDDLDGIVARAIDFGWLRRLLRRRRSLF